MHRGFPTPRAEQAEESPKVALRRQDSCANSTPMYASMSTMLNGANCR